MNLWRLHIRPDLSKSSKKWTDVISYCLTNNVAGIGWRIPFAIPRTKDEYISLAQKEYKKNSIASINFARDIQENDLLWARDLNGKYYLGKIDSDWYYSDNNEDLALDIPNQRKCSWVALENIEYVPGKILACFRPTRAFQAIKDPLMIDFSQWLYNQISKSGFYSISENPIKVDSPKSFFRAISAEDCEDVVGLYLQKELGYHLIPSSCKRSTVGYEFILKHSETGRTAAAQVKQGHVNITDDIFETADDVFFFSTEGSVDINRENTKELTAENLHKFALENKALLPKKILFWFNDSL